MVEKSQLVASAAEVYDSFFLPALFEEWAARVAEAARIQPGDRVLDIACGTGVLARRVAEIAGSTGKTVGLDVNENMLSVARSKAPQIEWRNGNAEDLPFDPDAFDVIVSQFGLMFFANQLAALQEMKRVLRVGGTLSLAVWGPLKDSPGYAEMTELLRRLFGDDTASALEAPFALGDKNALGHLFTKAGMSDAEIVTQQGRARFPSIREWVYTEIKGWTLAEVLDDEQYQLLLQQADKDLRKFVNRDGSVSFSIAAHIVGWQKR
jgi:SAM-dependent methyltransferase